MFFVCLFVIYLFIQEGIQEERLMDDFYYRNEVETLHQAPSSANQGLYKLANAVNLYWWQDN